MVGSIRWKSPPRGRTNILICRVLRKDTWPTHVLLYIPTGQLEGMSTVSAKEAYEKYYFSAKRS
jgi:hypothetical protein